jgi:hypothetical protein
MKKLSTRAAVQSRNISQQKLTIGLDLGERNCWYCMLERGSDTTRAASADDGQSVAGSLRRDATQSDRSGRDCFPALRISSSS